MDISRFFSSTGGSLRFTRQQASEFAKGVAGDFNPIHDTDHKRFCVPGDLLFSVLLHRYGVHRDMQLDFAGMVTEKAVLRLPEVIKSPLYLVDERDRNCLTLLASGDTTNNSVFIRELTRHYVQFSGKTFPDILVDLMRKAGVMINPARPLVIYKDMNFHLNQLSGEALQLSLADAELTVKGKKGQARLAFEIHAGGHVIGRGEKNMLLSGLREFDETAMASIVEQYNQWKLHYQEKHNAV